MNLFYRKFGQGPVMIILHGLYGSSDNWISIGKVLSNHFEVFLPDLRNHGNSIHSNEHNYNLLKNDEKLSGDDVRGDKRGGGYRTIAGML